MDIVKTIEEEIVSIHQIMKEQIKTHVPQEGGKDGITRGKMKGYKVYKVK